MEASPQICQINTTQPTSNWMLLQFSKRRQRWSFDFSRYFIFPLSSTHPSTQPPSRPASHQPLPRSSLDEDPKKGKVEKSVSLFFFPRMNVQISSNSVFHLKPTSFPPIREELSARKAKTGVFSPHWRPGACGFSRRALNSSSLSRHTSSLKITVSSEAKRCEWVNADQPERWTLRVT